MHISAQDRQTHSDAIRSAEGKTSGEIVCVLARSSSEAATLPVFIAAVRLVRAAVAAGGGDRNAGVPDIVAADRGVSCLDRVPLPAACSRHADARVPRAVPSHTAPR